MDFNEKIRQMNEYLQVQRLLGTYGMDEFGVYENTGMISLKKINTPFKDGLYIVPDFVDLLENYVISHTEGLKHIKIGSNVRAIQKFGLADNATIEKIEIAYGLKQIGESAFVYNEYLKELILPNSVEIIRESIVSHCKRLERLVIPESTKICETQRMNNIRMFDYLEIPTKFSGKLIMFDNCKHIRYTGDEIFEEGPF